MAASSRIETRETHGGRGRRLATRVDGEDGLAEVDPEVFALLAGEEAQRRATLCLVASESPSSPAVRQALMSGWADRSADGMPGARQHSGCETIDALEELACSRLCQLLGADHANVQPHSGTQANLAVYHALCGPGATILSMDPAHGGHISHGHAGTLAKQVWRFVHYPVDRYTERIDMDEVRRIAEREKPTLIVAGAAAYPRRIDFAAFASVAQAVGARLLVDLSQLAGLVIAGLHPNPVPHADVVTLTTHKTLRGPRGGAILCRAELAAAVDRAVFPGVQSSPLVHVIAAKAVCFREAADVSFVEDQRRAVDNATVLSAVLGQRGFRQVSGGTDVHLVLVDLRRQGITGRQAERALEEAGIRVDKHLVPFDPQVPSRTSGIRAGSQWVTALGMREPDMTELADTIADVLTASSLGKGAQEEAVALAQCRVQQLRERLSRENRADRGNRVP